MSISETVREALLALCSLLWVLLHAWLLCSLFSLLGSPLLSLLSPYTIRLLQGVKCHPLGISPSPFVIAEYDDWCAYVCVGKREREREIGREKESESMQEKAGEDILVCMTVGFFSQRVYEDGVG